MAQKPVLRGEVGARALRNPEGRGKGRLPLGFANSDDGQADGQVPGRNTE